MEAALQCSNNYATLRLYSTPSLKHPIKPLIFNSFTHFWLKSVWNSWLQQSIVLTTFEAGERRVPVGWYLGQSKQKVQVSNLKYSQQMCIQWTGMFAHCLVHIPNMFYVKNTLHIELGFLCTILFFINSTVHWIYVHVRWGIQQQ